MNEADRIRVEQIKAFNKKTEPACWLIILVEAQEREIERLNRMMTSVAIFKAQKEHNEMMAKKDDKVEKLKGMVLAAQIRDVNEYGPCWCNTADLIIWQHQPKCKGIKQAFAEIEEND